MRRRILFAIKLLVSLGLLVLLASWLNLSELADRYADVVFVLLALGVMVLTTQVALSALKWRLILRADGNVVSFFFLWKTNWIGTFFSLFLPTSFGGDVYRVYAIRHASQSLEKGASSVLFDRVTGLIALVSISALSSLFMPENKFVWVVLVVYSVFILTFVGVTSDAVAARLPSFRGNLANFTIKVLRSFNSYSKDRRRLFVIFLISFAFQLNIVVINYFYAHALRIDVSFTKLLVVIPLIYLTEVLPISINGLGVRESAFVSGYILMGHSAEEGLAVSILVVTLRYLIGSVGGILLLFDRIRAPRDQ